MPEATPIRKPVSINAKEITASRRIYVIGFNRCGTRSLTTAFKQAGIGCVHWDRNQLMLAILSDLRRHGRINPAPITPRQCLPRPDPRAGAW